MGILNVTPDSFSDGAKHSEPDAAVAHGLAMAAAGAGVIDVGGESTRPGAKRVGAEEQKRRVVEVIGRVRAALDESGRSDVAISIDTTLSAVAAAALEAGASILNDISGGCEDEGMFKLAATSSAPIVLMHMQGEPGTMQNNPTYQDAVVEVKQYLLARAEAAMAAGVARAKIVLDPGIGFGKAYEHNLALINGLHEFVETGYPILLGASRKKFMRMICEADGAPPAPDQMVGATCAATVLGVMQGVQILRVHDVAENRQAADVAFAMMRGS